MVWKAAYQDIVKDRQWGERLSLSKHGLEKEALRVNPRGELALSAHPSHFGSPLKHPFISLDFSDAQLELITQPFKSRRSCLRSLREILAFVAANLTAGEFLWPNSLPCQLPKESAIPIAQFGSTEEGKKKEIYRQGLSHRYGKKMQMISGVHHNFSFDQSFWQALYDYEGEGEFSSWVSEQYLAIVRNYLRKGWIVSYLMGRSPAADSSYFSRSPKWLKQHAKQTLYGPYATSLRMSRWGYFSKVQAQHSVSYNSLSEHCTSLEKCLQTTHPAFAKIGLMSRGKQKQLNDKLLQVEAEHYSRIRAKASYMDKGLLYGLRQGGVHYLELRALDNNPMEIEGVSADSMLFHQLLILACALEKSPLITPQEQKEICANQAHVASHGRKPRLRLERKGHLIALQKWALEILDQMAEVSSLLPTSDQKAAHRLIAESRKMALNPEETPSAQMIEELLTSKKEFVDYNLERSVQQTQQLANMCSPETSTKMQRASLFADEEEAKQRAKEDYFLAGYEDLEISTQMVLREAQKQKIQVEAIDRKSHIFRLQQGKKTEVICRATYTSKDPLISYFLMENKQVSKNLLQEVGIRVPKGVRIFTKEEAGAFLSACEQHVVVKPASTNFGQGISFVDPQDAHAVQQALHQAFMLDEEVLLEEFCQGEEYRFLVVGGECIAVCQRIPANIVGDGKRTVRALVGEKNRNPRCFKMRYPLRIGKVEKAFLQEQGLSSLSIPSAGKRVFLRRNSNVSTGGDTIDFTDSTHQEYKKIAEQAAKAAQANLCGVDIMIEDPSNFTSTGYAVLEINFNPALYLHRYPLLGTTRYVEQDVLKLLGFRIK